MSGDSEDAMAHLSFESIHRTLDAMPIVVVLDVYCGRVELLADIPPDTRLFDAEMDDVASRGDLTVNQHGSLPGTSSLTIQAKGVRVNRTSCVGIPLFRCADVTRVPLSRR
jgi:hypothetical protein